MATPSTVDTHWYLIQCKTGQDKRASEHLARQGFHCYRPVRTIERIRGGRTQSLAESLLPGYLFIRLDPLNDNWRSIQFTRGVWRFVCFNGGEPVPIADDVVAAIHHRCAGTSNTPATDSGTEVNPLITPNTDEQRISKLLSMLHRH